MQGIKLKQIGNSVGIILPKEVLARLKLEMEDTVFLTDTPGGVIITPNDAEFAAQMDEARKIMKARRNVLHDLAK